MKLIKFSLYLFVSVLFFASCGSASHHFYATDEGNLVALREEKDIKVSAGYTPHVNSLPGNNISAQVGYSPIKHLGVHASYFRIRNSFTGAEDIEKNVYQYNFNGAVGGYYFKPAKAKEIFGEDGLTSFESATEGKGLLFDGYVGYGRGAVNNFYFGETGKVELDFQKIYLQGGFHIFLDKVGASFTLRGTQLSYLDSSKAYGRLSASQLRKIEIIEENNPFFFLESALKISIGKPTAPIRGYLTLAGVYDFGDVFLEVQPSTMQFGVTTDINYLFSKKEKKKNKKKSSKRKRTRNY
ncbi:MAG: hypothetical protein AB8H03_28750 [Saprospiraceae bacterium]